MNAIRKSALAIVLLGMSVGCGGEPETAPDAGGAPTTSKPNYPTAADKNIKPAKVAPAPDTKPGEMKKVDEAPAVEGPKADAGRRETDGRRARRHQGIARRRTDRGDPQAVCPVSTHHLGSMEKPVKVTAEGRTFYLCCESLREGTQGRPQGGHRQARQKVSVSIVSRQLSVVRC